MTPPINWAWKIVMQTILKTDMTISSQYSTGENVEPMDIGRIICCCRCCCATFQHSVGVVIVTFEVEPVVCLAPSLLVRVISVRLDVLKRYFIHSFIDPIEVFQFLPVLSFVKIRPWFAVGMTGNTWTYKWNYLVWWERIDVVK